MKSLSGQGFQAESRLTKWNAKAGGTLEGLNGTGLVRLDVEYGVQLGQLKQIMHPLARIDEFQMSAMAPDGCIRLN